MPLRASHLGTGVALLAATGSILWMRQEKARLLRGEPAFTRTYDPYRLKVKLGLDPGARNIPDEPKATSLAKLLTLPHDGATEGARLDPLETTRWTMRVLVEDVSLRPDGDLVLEIRDGPATSTAEVPDSSLCAGTPFESGVIRVRQDLIARFRPRNRPRPMLVQAWAEITGVGFAGLPGHVSRSGVKLYPALAIRWLPPSGSAR